MALLSLPSPHHATYSHKLAAPIRNIHALHAHLAALARAVDEGIAACIQARVQGAGAPPGAEDDNIARAGAILGHSLAGMGLFDRNAGDPVAVHTVGPPDEARAVKALLGRRAAGPVFLAHLAVGRADDLARRGGGRACIYRGSEQAAAGEQNAAGQTQGESLRRRAEKCGEKPVHAATCRCEKYFCGADKGLVYEAPCKVFFGKKGQDIMGPTRAAERGKMHIAVARI